MLQNRRIVMVFFRNDKVIMAHIQLTHKIIVNGGGYRITYFVAIYIYIYVGQFNPKI